MYPPVFSVAVADSGVIAALGSNPTRLYPFDEAPIDSELPYSVWQTITGTPENYLGNLPDADSYTVQVDVYSSTATSARDAAMALRDAFEPVSYVVNWGRESKETQTGNYRFSFDVAFIQYR